MEEEPIHRGVARRAASGHQVRLNTAESYLKHRVPLPAVYTWEETNGGPTASATKLLSTRTQSMVPVAETMADSAV